MVGLALQIVFALVAAWLYGRWRSARGDWRMGRLGGAAVAVLLLTLVVGGHAFAESRGEQTWTLDRSPLLWLGGGLGVLGAAAIVSLSWRMLPTWGSIDWIEERLYSGVGTVLAVGLGVVVTAEGNRHGSTSPARPLSMTVVDVPAPRPGAAPEVIVDDPATGASARIRLVGDDVVGLHPGARIEVDVRTGALGARWIDGPGRRPATAHTP